MKLYKDVKVELRSLLTIKFSDYFADKLQIKKYKGQTKVVECLDSTRISKNTYNYTNALKQHLLDDLFRIIEDTINYDKDSSYNLNSIIANDYKINEYINDIQESSRTEAIRKGKYDITIILELKFDVYGKLFIGQSNEFEECFETQSGLKVDELIKIDSIKSKIDNFLITEWSKYCKDLEVSSSFYEEVKLLPFREDEFSEAIYAHSDDISDAIDKHLDWKINGDPWDD